jgi:1,4-dihydroxy-2-naphthoyl-CoA hydrolase
VNPWHSRFRIALHDTDAAGVLFYGHLFRRLHDAYEQWMEHLGFPLDTLIRRGEIALPLVHAQADYRKPMRHGDWISVSLGLSELEADRFALAYRCVNAHQAVTATALTRHVCIDPQCQRSRPLPWALADALGHQD